MFFGEQDQGEQEKKRLHDILIKKSNERINLEEL